MPHRTSLSRSALWWLIALALSRPAWSAEPATLEIGIIPTLSTRTILATYQPLRSYLEEHLKQPVTLVTATDYRTFVERTQRGEYRFVVTAPHFARFAQAEAGYRPMVRVKRELRGLLVTRANSDIRRVADLRGKSVSTPEGLALITMLGEQLLRDHGLTPGRDVEVRHLASFNSAVLAVHNGQSAAALTATTALKQMPEEVRNGLREVAMTRAVPHVIYLAHPQVPAAEVNRMTELLLAFEKRSPQGSEFFDKTGFLGYERPTPQELRSLDPYVAEVKKQLAAP